MTGHFPIRNVKFNKNFHKKEKWMTKGLLRSRETKIRLANEKSKFPSEENRKIFKDYKNLYNKLLRAAKKLHYSNLLIESQGDLKKSWSVIREASGLSNKKSNLTDSLKINGVEVRGDKNLAKEFNAHFSNIASDIKREYHPY